MRLSRASVIELKRRNVTRTLNAPLGDWCELLVAIAFNGTRAPNSEKGWDVCTGVEKLQAKSRATTTSTNFSPFRSFDFDAGIFVIFDPDDLSVVEAKRLTPEVIQNLATHSKHVKGDTVTVNQIRAAEGADVTEDLVRAQDGVEDYLAALEAREPEST